MQEKRLRVVQRAQTAKQLKLEVQRAQLREEENYHFHRLTASHLAEAVHSLFVQQGRAAQAEVKEQPKEEEQRAVVKQNQDDIFVDGDEYYGMAEGDNLLDDLLNDPIVEKKEEDVQRQEPPIEHISVLIAQKYAAAKNGAQLQPIACISRKLCLKRINESVRRRLKIKQEQEQLPGRSLSSATVFLSSLLNVQPQAKAKTLIDLPSKTDWIFSSDRTRKRQAGEEAFQLRWSPQQMEKLQQRNEKWLQRKGKFDSNLLLVSLNNDEDEYKKHFDKNIAADRAFPPTLQNVPQLQITHPPRYYNQFHDPAYQSFIRKHNKRAIFQKFAAKAAYLFPQNYGQEDVEDSQSVSAGKIFVHPPDKVLDRLIFRIADYRLSAAVRSDFSHLRMDLNQMLILAFLARSYVRQFGNDWRSVTQFIAMHPVFASHHVTQETVQEVYQLVAKFDGSDPLSQINLWDKKILPFEHYACYSYAEFDQSLYQPAQQLGEKMQSEEETEHEQRFDFDNYDQLLREAPEQPILGELDAQEEQYRRFAKPVFEKMTRADHSFVANREDKFTRIRTVLNKFKDSSDRIEYSPDDRDRRENVGKVLDEMVGSARGGDFKQATPFRKKKNINQRNNELVKILQALRNKNVGVAGQNLPKKPEQAAKSFPQATAPKAVPAATNNPPPAAVPKQEPANEQKKTMQKSPEKADKKQLGAPPKKDRKNKDGEDKKIIQQGKGRDKGMLRVRVRVLYQGQGYCMGILACLMAVALSFSYINIQMAEIEYRNRSISQLVSELNHLGEPGVLLSSIRLTAIHEKDMPDLKRFKNSQGQQFFIPNNSQKKFPYADIAQSLSASQLDLVKELFLRGFNITVLFGMPREQGRLTQLLGEIAKLVGDCACSAACFNEQGIVDGVSGGKLAERDFEGGRLKYYRTMESTLIAFLDKMLRGQTKGTISLIKVRSLQSGPSTPSPNQVNLICLPEDFFSPGLKLNEFLGLCKSQLTQIFNYIKLSPANKYQHFSKVVTKRMPATNILAGLLLESTATLVVNWMNEGGNGVIHERLSFYDKMRELSVLLKKQEGTLPLLVNDLPNDFKLSRHEKPPKNSIKPSKTDRTPVAAFQEETELDYCRSFERKTHKYSINDVDPFDQHDSPFDDSSRLREASNTPSPVTHFPSNEKCSSREMGRFDETMPRKPNPQSYRETEQIAILKANHAIEISQYHLTIQELNRKILVLAKERDLEQLYTVHEREIMLLQLKIKQLRNDLSTLCSNSHDEKSYKSMVRKLNEEIKRLEGKHSEQKVSHGKAIILERQLGELRGKYEESEKARKKLTFQLENLTKRLKICDSEIQVLANKDANLKTADQKNKLDNNGPSLSLNDTQSLKEVHTLIKSIQEGSEQSKGFLLRKITNLMSDLSACRDSILECNDFLVQLEEHLEERLGSKEPQIVLDCNRFIRNFLMESLNVF